MSQFGKVNLHFGGFLIILGWWPIHEFKRSCVLQTKHDFTEINFDNPAYEGMELSEIADSPSETSKEPGNFNEGKFKLCKVNFFYFMSHRSKYQLFYATSVVYGESDHWKPAHMHYLDMGYHF